MFFYLVDSKGNGNEYRIYSNKHRGAYLIFRVSGAALIRGRPLFKRLIPQRQNYFKSIFFMANRLEANFGFGFHNSLVQVFNNAPLDVNVLTVAESSQDLTQDALYLSLCI